MLCCVVLYRGELMSYQRSHLGLAWRIIITSAPLSRAHRSASSAAQRRAVPRGVVPCRTLSVPCRAILLCGAVPCCAESRAFCRTFPTCQVSFKVSYHRYYCYICTRHYIVESQKKKSHSSSQPSHSSATQRRAVPYGAAPCPAVLCRAALCFLSNIQQYQVSCDTRYRPVVVCTCVLIFFSLFI